MCFPGDVAGQSLDNISPVRLAVGDYFIGTGMIAACRLQVMRVERLIAHECVRAIPHDRIIAVEMFRGPDHIAMRTG